MNTKTTAPHPSQGELAEQRHLIDPLDHVLEHLADEQQRVNTPRLTPQREAEIRAFEEDEHRNVLTMGRDLDDLLAEVDRLRAEANQLHHELDGANLARWEEEQTTTRLRAELAALPAPTVEHGFRDADGQAWPTKGLPARTVELISNTNFRLQRTVRYGEWTEVTA